MEFLDKCTEDGGLSSGSCSEAEAGEDESDLAFIDDSVSTPCSPTQYRLSNNRHQWDLVSEGSNVPETSSQDLGELDGADSPSPPQSECQSEMGISSLSRSMTQVMRSAPLPFATSFNPAPDGWCFYNCLLDLFQIPNLECLASDLYCWFKIEDIDAEAVRKLNMVEGGVAGRVAVMASLAKFVDGMLPGSHWGVVEDLEVVCRQVKQAIHVVTHRKDQVYNSYTVCGSLYPVHKQSVMLRNGHFTLCSIGGSSCLSDVPGLVSLVAQSDAVPTAKPGLAPRFKAFIGSLKAYFTTAPLAFRTGESVMHTLGLNMEDTSIG